MKQKTKTTFLALLFNLILANLAFASTDVDSAIAFFKVVDQFCKIIQYTAPAIGLLCFAGGVYQLATRGAEGNHLMANLFWGALGCGLLWGGSTKMIKWMMGNTSEGATIDDVAEYNSTICIPQIDISLLCAMLCAMLLIACYFSKRNEKMLKCGIC